jgi:D-alanyl-D-alanine dipeptidase
MRVKRPSYSKGAIVAALGMAGFVMPSSAAPPSSLPADFVFLRDVDPTIQQDMRYATPNNFTGSPLPGYDGAECVLRQAVADALRRVQRELAGRNLSLKVFDCYRPTRAVAAMARWAKDGTSGAATRNYFPREQKNKLFARGYIASRSGHSLGTTADLTLTELSPVTPANSDARLRAACDAPAEQRGNADGIDMGTSFDCFDVRSWTENNEVADEQRRWRRYLRSSMSKYGFSNYAQEWWHYTFRGVTGPAFDFPIPKR